MADMISTDTKESHPLWMDFVFYRVFGKDTPTWAAIMPTVFKLFNA